MPRETGESREPGEPGESRATEERRRWQRVQSLFHRARELVPLARAPFLDEHCGSDAELRGELDELLAEALSTSEPSAGARGREPEEDLSGQRLGHHELLRIVGRGSMGVIYEARQRYVRRSVALKLLRSRADVLRDGGSPEAYDRMTARFLDEAEVLGRLDHPGIVPIHEMERGADARCYFTMRLVVGQDLRAIIREVHRVGGSWALNKALHVIVRVCETMAFAHERGVLHRDLKPSHVMAGPFGEVYIVDWGLAKLLDRPDPRDLRIRPDDAAARPSGSPSERTPPARAADTGPDPLRTIEGDVLGTPAYMPPEQARGRLHEIDRRSDVYGVGAILYHVLTGRMPHLRSGETSVPPRELLERVKQGPPEPVARVNPLVPPALAAVCAKAMARDRARRYDGMEALADDLLAFLEHRVVSAHRTGLLTGIGKWMQRNRALSTAVALLVVLALAWSASASISRGRSNARLQRTNRDLAAANQEIASERDAARSQAAIATAVGAFLNGMLRAIDPANAQGEEVTVRAALDAAAERIDGAFPGQPEVEAAVRTTLGITYRHLGDPAAAEPHLRWALEARQHLAGERAPETLRSLEELAILRRDQGRLEEAERLLREALDGHRAFFGPESRAALRSMGNLGQVLFDRQLFTEAEQLAREVLLVQERRFGTDDADVLISLGVLASALYRRGELGEATELFQRQYAANRERFGEAHSNTLLAASSLVTVLDAAGRGDEARATSEGLLARMREVFGPRHRNTILAGANSALLLCNQGHTAEGLALFEETLELERSVLGADHPETRLTAFNYAEILRRHGRQDEALPLYLEVLEWQAAHLPAHDRELLDTQIGLADSLMALGEHDEALALLGEILAAQRATFGPDDARTRATERQVEVCRARVGG